MRLRLEPGKVLRTEDLTRYGKNPTRLAGKLVEAGKLRRLRKGVYYVPQASAFGEVPPSHAEVLRAYFRGRPFLQTGPSVWNGLGLGTTAVEAIPLVYNTTRTGLVEVGGRRFELRRVRFPRQVTAEYLVVDLMENIGRAGGDVERVAAALAAAVKAGRFDAERLLAMGARYSTRATQQFLQSAVRGTG